MEARKGVAGLMTRLGDRDDITGILREMQRAGNLGTKADNCELVDAS